MLYIKYSIYTNKGRKLKFPALSFFLKKVNSFGRDLGRWISD